MLFLSFLSFNNAWTQNNANSINIPLSNPGEKGLLILDNTDGSITIVGTDRSDILVKIKDNNIVKKAVSKALMNIDISEDQNIIEIKEGSERVNYTIEVPKSFDLSLNTVYKNSNIKVTDVIGNIEVEAYESNIKLSNVGGAIIAENYYGNIEADIQEIFETKPMGFTSYYGNIEVLFPSNSNCQLKMRSVRGQIYTDFDLSFSKDPNGTKIKEAGWINVTIGKGGKKYLFTNYFGDVSVRKRIE